MINLNDAIFKKHSVVKIYGCHKNKVKCLLFVLAGIHYLILDQNRVVLKQNLVIDDRMSRWWQKSCSKEEYILPTASIDKRNESFTEWLKWKPLKDYKHFISLLKHTEQESLAAQLEASCKVI